MVENFRLARAEEEGNSVRNRPLPVSIGSLENLRQAAVSRISDEFLDGEHHWQLGSGPNYCRFLAGFQSFPLSATSIG